MKLGVLRTHGEMGLMERMERLGSLTPKRILHRDDLQPGDHICTDRNKKSYYHHGIYLGNNRVIHFTKVTERKHAKEKDICRHIEGEVNTTAHPTRGVRLICLTCFLRQHTLCKVEYGLRLPVTDYLGESREEKLCDDAETVVARAWEKLERNDFGEYSLLWRNCETFAFFCKTGEYFPFGSRQTQWLCEFYLGALGLNGCVIERSVLEHDGDLHHSHLFHHFDFHLHFHARRSLVEPITVEAGYRGVATQALLPSLERFIYLWHLHC